MSPRRSATGRDILRPFLFEHFGVRGELVHLDASWRAVLARHEYPPVVRTALGEAMVASVLLASTLKFDGVLTLQIQGGGPLRLLVTQCTSERRLRGLARWGGEVPEGTLAEMTGEGRLSITVERRSENQRYQGIVPLRGSSIAECLQAYLRDSDQLPTRLFG